MMWRAIALLCLLLLAAGLLANGFLALSFVAFALAMGVIFSLRGMDGE